jgi:glycosyltransferase involved in cell wall biosynthesis
VQRAVALTVSGASRTQILARKIQWQGAKLSEQAALHFSPAAAIRNYWTLNGVFTEIYESAAREKVDIWLANDWSSLPIVQRLAREQNVPYIYDTHELAVFEYSQNLRWRLGMRPVIAAVERAGIHGAAAVSCVSDGIADRLHSFHRLEDRPRVIRNMPSYAESPFRPVGEKIGVLYHGMVFPGRGLEEAIESLPAWRDAFHFTIRGPGPEDYIALLKDLADRHRVTERVTFAPPVPMIDLVQEAQSFDVGFFAIRGHSLQNTYVLPNKFFEYAMAGLALCVSDLPEMRKLLDRYGMGILMRQCEPAAIAQAVNSLTRPAIDNFKRKSLEGAKELCWENEGKAFLAMAERALGQRAGLIEGTTIA